MNLRPAQAADASSLAALSIEVWLGTYIRNGVNGFFADYALTQFTPERYRASLDDPDEHVIVSMNADGIDGFARVSSGKTAPLDPRSTMELSTLYVQPRHHGKGIGRALLEASLCHARPTGSPSIWLTTNAENMQAIGFYRSQGFERIGTTQFRIGDQSYPNEVFRYSF